jgi:hypothetical protein
MIALEYCNVVCNGQPDLTVIEVYQIDYIAANLEKKL